MCFISTNDKITLIFEHLDRRCFAPYIILLNCTQNEENNHIMRCLAAYSAVCVCLIYMSCFVSCKKGPEAIKPEPEPSGEIVSLALTASLPETKTVLGPASNGATPLFWTPEDRLWVRSAKQEADSPGSLFTTSSSGISVSGRVAEFSGESLNAGPYLAVSPYSSVLGGG